MGLQPSALPEKVSWSLVSTKVTDAATQSKTAKAQRFTMKTVKTEACLH